MRSIQSQAAAEWPDTHCYGLFPVNIDRTDVVVQLFDFIETSRVWVTVIKRGIASRDAFRDPELPIKLRFKSFLAFFLLLS